MSQQRKRKRVPTEKRRWRSPPPILRDAESPGPEGLSVLDEIQSELGTVLWKALRSVTLWTGATKAQRKTLFPESTIQRRRKEIAASTPPGQKELRKALDALTALLDRASAADPQDIGETCRRIHGWAAANHAPRTALEFLQAAALCLPSDGALALEIARAIRDLGQHGRSEAWLWRAVGLARRAGDWYTYIDAYLEHGRMMHRRGAWPAARRSYTKALRRAVRQGSRALEGEVLQELFVLEDRAGHTERCVAYARRASNILGSGHPGLPRLARDLGVFWIRRGRFELALPILREAVDRLDHEDLGQGLGSLALAAGHVGDEATFDRAVQELDRWWEGPGVAEAWADVARGALALDRLDGARDAADRAETMARKRGEGLTRIEAETLLESIQAEARSTGEREPASNLDTETGSLSREILASLQAQPAGA